MVERLEKLRITNLDSKPQERFFVLFNPSEYTLEDASHWVGQHKMGQKPELHYTGGERKKLMMELFFDTYEARTDVRQHTQKIASLLVCDKEKHCPPKVELSWGLTAPGGPYVDFPFVCVLETLKQQFVLFLGDGTPVRAKLSATFIEFTLPEDEEKKNPKNSPDRTKLYVVKVRDTLSGIAGLFYEEPSKWREIAMANDIDTPRQLTPGSMLRIPKIA
jgi:contractile injection system tube protein/LysM domain-containing protein